ncbi:MAG: repressor protein [Elusimicrobia bacterium RIFOXYA2_FULL_39_19]|nr:MAG: repressor protein [Elusimicrobia bacterium RIFOXYA2_FULL_39_19]
MDCIGKTIKTLREAAGMSQQELADKLSIQRVAITQIESGSRDVCADEIKGFSEIFQVSSDVLLGLAAMPKVSIEEVKTMPARKEALRISVPQKNLKKFKEVLLYILNKAGGKPNIGETALYKLLYFIDFNYYEKYEDQLIGATYIKNHYGPSPVEFKHIVEKMISDKEVLKLVNKHFGYDQKKYLALKKPDLSILNAREKQTIDDVLALLSDKNAKELSEYSHNDVPWLTAEEGKPISYEAVFYRTSPYSVREDDDL